MSIRKPDSALRKRSGPDDPHRTQPACLAKSSGDPGNRLSSSPASSRYHFRHNEEEQFSDYRQAAHHSGGEQNIFLPEHRAQCSDSHGFPDSYARRREFFVREKSEDRAGERMIP